MAEDAKGPLSESPVPKVIRAGMQVVGSVVPFAGGLLSAAQKPKALEISLISVTFNLLARGSNPNLLD